MPRFDSITGRETLHNWLSVAPFPIHLLDPEGRPHSPNPAMAALLGLEHQQLDTTDFARCIPGRTRDRLLDALDTSPSRPYTERTLVYRHRSGIEIEAQQARIGPLNTPSTPPLVMLDEVQPSQRLDRAKVQSRMSRLIAHDLNNVFTVAQSYVDLARREHMTARLAGNYLQRAAKAIRRGIRVSQQLQTIVIEKPFPTEECAIEDVIDGLEPFMSRLLPTGPEWSIHCRRSLPIVMSHPALLSRFIIDFVINAHLRWPQCAQMQFDIRRSPSRRPTIMMRIEPPESTPAALPIPFRLFLCQSDPFSPDQVDPLFISDILARQPIALEKADQSLTALLPAPENQ